MKIKLNGSDIDIENGMSVLSLLEWKAINPAVVVVEYNLEIPEREKWADIKLSEGDSLEIVRFMGGG